MKPIHYAALILLSIGVLSCIVMDLNNTGIPVAAQARNWVAAHPWRSALAVSETAGLLSSKWRGIIQSVLKLLQLLLDAIPAEKK